MIRRAEPADVDFAVELLAHDEVEPFLSKHRSNERADLLARIERSQAEPASTGVFVIEVDGARAGLMEFETFSERSRIASLGGLALHPDFRGRGVARQAAQAFRRHLLLDLGFHRLQLEVYGFNERGIAHAEEAGFVREGVKRKAYLRHGAWSDGVLFGLVREDLGLPPAVDLLHEYAARHNQGVRTGDWEPLGECFAADAVLAFEGVPVGPFAGREAIVAAYRERPPDDEVRILDATGQTATYGWLAAPDEPAGTMRLEPAAAGLIASLTITV